MKRWPRKSLGAGSLGPSAPPNFLRVKTEAVFIIGFMRIKLPGKPHRSAYAHTRMVYDSVPEQGIEPVPNSSETWAEGGGGPSPSQMAET